MVRLKSVPKLANLTLSFYSDAEVLAEWSSIELALGITAACLATLRPLLRRIIETTRTINSRISSSRSTRNRPDPSLGSGANSNEQNNILLGMTNRHWAEGKDVVSFMSTTCSAGKTPHTPP
jgi:hypothetical protein